MKRLFALLLVFGGAFLALAAFGSVSQAQTFNVLYAFGAGGDGAAPWAGVTLDRSGRIYGTTAEAGHGGAGTVYMLKNYHGTWQLSALHEFLPANGDGGVPQGRAVFGPDGRLYGTTTRGGASGYWGTVYRLGPPATICGSIQCYWDEAILYSFMGGHDGAAPWFVDPVFDQNGNIYGTAQQGGATGNGVVFELSKSGNAWTESVLHSFSTSEGIQPSASVLLDPAGNIWGTTSNGINQTGYGSVFELSSSGSGWNANIVHIFQGEPDGADSVSSLTMDAAGHLYGMTSFGGQSNSGSVFELSASGGSWSYAQIYNGFSGGGGPNGPLVADAAGNLYGTSWFNGAHQLGVVFKLTTNGSGGWTYSSVHDFTGGDDGSYPYGGVTFDAQGNMYGTASGGGRYGRGVVWEITP
jgi:uncharacterized repeat protein (TIGR03803 family)